MPLLTPIAFPSEPAAFAIESQAEFVAAGASGDTFKNPGKTALYVKNTSGASRTVTITAPRACNFHTTHNAAVVVPNNFAGFIALDLPGDRFNSAAGVVTLTYSSNVGLSVAAVRLP